MTHRRLAGLALGLALGAFGACTPTEPTVQPYFLSVDVVGSPTVALDRLRLTSVLEGDDPSPACRGKGTGVVVFIWRGTVLHRGESYGENRRGSR